MNAKIKLVSDEFIPEYKTEKAACADCHANVNEDVVIAPGCSVSIPLGFALEMEEGWEAVLEPRSGLARKNGVVLVHGEIDEDYRGELGATLENHSSIPFTVHRGDRVCQIKFIPYYQATFQKVENLSETVRGEGGFGSTGV